MAAFFPPAFLIGLVFFWALGLAAFLAALGLAAFLATLAFLAGDAAGAGAGAGTAGVVAAGAATLVDFLGAAFLGALALTTLGLLADFFDYDKYMGYW